MSPILGLDPGSRRTGYGLIESRGGAFRFLGCGVIRLDARAPVPERLGAIHRELRAVMKQWEPAEVAIESTFVHRNIRSALVLGQARGAALAAVMDGPAPPQVAEYSPRQVKLSMTAFGGAEKIQVQKMVALILGLREMPAEDAADALAVAICHAFRGHGPNAAGGGW
jgi:crossover junction endodeoxyribonuclease RuvC